MRISYCSEPQSAGRGDDCLVPTDGTLGTLNSIVIAGTFTLLLFLVFSYLYRQSREGYFRAWQLAWAAYSLHYACLGWAYFGQPRWLPFLLSKLLLAAVAAGIYISTRLVQEDFRWQAADGALGLGGALLVGVDFWAHLRSGGFRLEAEGARLQLETGIALLLLVCAVRFYRTGRQRDATGFRLLAFSLAAWVPLLLARQFDGFLAAHLGPLGQFLDLLPQMLIGVAMVIVLFEHERRVVQENTLAFSTLEVAAAGPLSPSELASGMDKMLARLMRLLRVESAAVCIRENWRRSLPSVARGFPPELLADLQREGSGEYLIDLAWRRGGLVTLRNLPALSEPLPAGPGGAFQRCRELMGRYRVESLSVASLQTRDQNFGMLLFAHQDREGFATSQIRLLLGLALQIGMTLENYLVIHDTQRRSRYLAFLNSVSNTAISSQEPEPMLAEIVSEIQKNFHFDHIGIGTLDYATKEIEIRAEAGTSGGALGRRIPLGVGLLGRCARSNEMILEQDGGDVRPPGILPDARSVLCLPLTYGETLLGVLNVESRCERAFAEQEILILRTLADLLATALHNAYVFQQLQQQSITDGLTGIKTRRFFLESVQSEWRRAARSGRPFSVVLLDLDKFKEVNDTMGHLEGDLVLARVGRLLEQKCRQSNVVARYGGDEFVILMPETSVEQAQTLSERLRVWLETDPALSQRHISGSFGVATFPLHGSTVEDIIRKADGGMYLSKKAGGNRVSTGEESADERSTLEQRQLMAFLEGFLQRQHTGPESVEELVSMLKKLWGSGPGREMLMEGVLALCRACEAREARAGRHGALAGHYAERLGRDLGFEPAELADLNYAARVHDVGNLLIPEKILAKQDPLTEEEYGLVKMHTSVGAEIAGCIPGSQRVQQIIRHHHERIDGSGYPEGLQGDSIPMGARILAVIDAYLAMTTDRPFKRVMSTSEAMEELLQRSGSQFDAQLVRLFIRHVKDEQLPDSRSAMA